MFVKELTRKRRLILFLHSQEQELQYQPQDYSSHHKLIPYIKKYTKVPVVILFPVILSASKTALKIFSLALLFALILFILNLHTISSVGYGEVFLFKQRPIFLVRVGVEKIYCDWIVCG